MVNIVSLGLVTIGTLIGSVGALILKKGMNKHQLKQFLLSRYFLGGFLFYGVSTIFYFLALRKEELSVVYPLVATAYIWTTILSARFLGEKINKLKVISLIGIIIGIILIGIGS